MIDTGGKSFESRLHELGELSDADIPVTETLLLLGALELGIQDLKPYHDHIQELHEALVQEVTDHPYREGDAVMAYRLARLNTVLRSEFGYGEDADSFGDVNTINMLTVIDRRKGIPVALGALYLELATAQDWPMWGLNFPGHFLMRLDHGSERLIIDPYSGASLDAGGMRRVLKASNGDKAELSHAYYDIVTSREVILRFYNNKKTRLITDSNYTEAVGVTRNMIRVAPNEPRLYFDCGILSVKQGLIKDALDYLKRFVDMSSDRRSITEAQTIIKTLQKDLH